MNGCATIYYMKRDPVDFVDQFFSVQNFISTHEKFGMILVNGSDMWYEALGALVLPLTFRVQLGRPKKLR